MLRVEEAQKVILDSVKSFYIKTKPIIDAIGFALYDDISADRDYPPFNRATMDGFAIKSSSVNNDKVKLFNIKAKTLAGSPPYIKELSKDDCVSIMTGSKVPTYADAVIPVEQCNVNGDDKITIALDRARLGLNIAKQGEDIKKGELFLKKGIVIDHSIVNVLSSFGHANMRVYGSPSIAIISTGDEVIPIDKSPLDYQIRDSNSFVLMALLKSSLNITPVSKLLVRDNKSELEQAIGEGIKEDILIISGGVSMGEADYVPFVLKSLGVKKLFHKVKVKPGKPLWFGLSDKGVVFGLPGNPLSCQITFKLFIEPYIRSFMHLKALEGREFTITRDRKKRTDRDDYFPCRADFIKNEISPINYSGSGDIKAGYGSNGFARHPLEKSLLEVGSSAEFYPWVAQ